MLGETVPVCPTQEELIHDAKNIPRERVHDLGGEVNVPASTTQEIADVHVPLMQEVETTVSLTKEDWIPKTPQANVPVPATQETWVQQSTCSKDLPAPTMLGYFCPSLSHARGVDSRPSSQSTGA